MTGPHLRTITGVLRWARVHLHVIARFRSVRMAGGWKRNGRMIKAVGGVKLSVLPAAPDFASMVLPVPGGPITRMIGASARFALSPFKSKNYGGLCSNDGRCLGVRDEKGGDCKLSPLRASFLAQPHNASIIFADHTQAGWHQARGICQDSETLYVVVSTHAPLQIGDQVADVLRPCADAHTRARASCASGRTRPPKCVRGHGTAQWSARSSRTAQTAPATRRACADRANETSATSWSHVGTESPRTPEYATCQQRFW
jgi:hypothetical protein